MANEPELDAAEKGKAPIPPQSGAPAAAEDVDDPDFDDLDGKHELPRTSMQA